MLYMTYMYLLYEHVIMDITRVCSMHAYRLQYAPVTLKAAAKPAKGHGSAERILGQ